MEVLKFVSSIVAITGLLGYIARNIIKLVIDKDLERFRNELKMTVFEHQIVYSKLHNDRAEVIRELYTKITRMERAMNDLAVYATEEKVEKALDKVLDAKYYFEENKIFFEPEVSNTVEEIIGATHNAYFEVIWNYEHQLHEIHDERTREQTLNKWLGGWKRIKDKVPELKNELETKFRDLLGANNSS